jgi:hypothetical protein
MVEDFAISLHDLHELCIRRSQHAVQLLPADSELTAATRKQTSSALPITEPSAVRLRSC